jgi:hypothetical protein
MSESRFKKAAVSILNPYLLTASPVRRIISNNKPAVGLLLECNHGTHRQSRRI